jgi:hypothetical protein
MADEQVPHYRLRFRNRSGNTLDFLCYQIHPDTKAPNTQALAWFAKPVADGADCDFTWALTYDFVWRETGHLASDIAFESQEIVPADLAKSNHIALSCHDGVFAFGKPGGGDPHGSLVIVCDSTIPPNEVQLGVGMAGAPVFLVSAQPNMSYNFTPHPEYWITAGQFTAGQVLDIASLVSPVQVQDPPNVHEMTATLDGSGKWTVQQGLG